MNGMCLIMAARSTLVVALSSCFPRMQWQSRAAWPLAKSATAGAVVTAVGLNRTYTSGTLMNLGKLNEAEHGEPRALSVLADIGKVSVCLLLGPRTELLESRRRRHTAGLVKGEPSRSHWRHLAGHACFPRICSLTAGASGGRYYSHIVCATSRGLESSSWALSPVWPDAVKGYRRVQTPMSGVCTPSLRLHAAAAAAGLGGWSFRLSSSRGRS